MIVLGIESTAHTFGIGIVENGKILSNMKKTYTTKKGGIIPIEAAKHHKKNKEEIYLKALEEAKVKESEINVIAFSQGPGLAPCLIEGMKFAKELSLKLKKPIVPVNHCIAHLEIGRTTGAHHGRTPKDFKKKSLLRAKITKYKASGGEEYFLEIVNSKDILFGLLRLRIIDVTSNKKTRLFSKINNSGNSRATLERGKSAIIRELHVYGKALGLGDSAHPTRARAQDSHKPSQTTRASRERSPILKNGSWVQHTGLGKQLMKKAEELAKDNCCEELKVISGVGVREYYKKLGYKLDGSYMVKEL